MERPKCQTLTEGGNHESLESGQNLVAIALNYARTSGLISFRIAPTSDTASYYRLKFNAQTGPDIATKKTLAVPLGPNRKPLPHVANIHSAGRIVALEVPVLPDPSWPRVSA